jgi:hypothetical protein
LQELASLYVFFALLYLFECATWVPRRAVGLVAPLVRWRSWRPFCPNTSWSGGALFGGPLPPLSPALVTEPLPLVLGPDGITHDSEFMPWDQVSRVAAAGHWLEVNGRRTALFSTRRGAAALTAAVAELSKLSRGKREVRLQRLLDQRFDEAAAGARWRVFARETRLLRIATNCLWAALFLGLPAIIWTPLGAHLLLPVALGLVAWVASAVLFLRGLRKSSDLPRTLWPDRTKRIVAVTSPLATIRARDLIARELIGDLDPLAAAAAFTPAKALGALARTRLVALTFGRDDDLPEPAVADARWARAQDLDRVRRLLRTHDVDPDQLLAAPRRDRDDMVAWCPACLAQYDSSVSSDVCPNEGCGGITLVRY